MTPWTLAIGECDRHQRRVPSDQIFRRYSSSLGDKYHHHHHHNHHQCNVIVKLMAATVIFVTFFLSLAQANPTPEALSDAIAAAFTSSTSYQTLSSESVTLSSRTIVIKYGQIRGNLVRLSVGSTRRQQQQQQQQLGVNPSFTLPDVEAYLGVPYATPPTGGLRFMPPVTPTHWRGLRLANRFAAVCPQSIPPNLARLVMNANEAEAMKHMPKARYDYLRRLLPLLANQSEDCLYLNIYTPSTVYRQQQQGHSMLPVVVFLHGESYEWHTGNVFDGSLLASYGQVVVVTLNYRLGVFGFLPAFADGTVRGNYGLMDQVAALHWVQENIGEFGGAVGNVTIVGHGHGAACAHLLMLSPMAKGLFTRVVLMSGSALSPWAIARDPQHYARQLGAKTNCTNLDTMIDCLRNRRVSELAEVALDVPDHLTAFGPIIDSIVVPVDPRQLYHLELYRLESSAAAAVGTRPARINITSSSSSSSMSSLEMTLGTTYDLMLGATDFDVPCIFSEVEANEGVEPQRRNRILKTIVRNLYDYHQQAIFLSLFNEYCDWWDSTNQRSPKVLGSTIAMLLDSLILSPLVLTADLHSIGTSASTSGRTFFYTFSDNNLDELDRDYYAQSREPESGGRRKHVCSNDDELAYMFGDPLGQLLFGTANGRSRIGPFEVQTNQTRQHLTIAEMFMQYLANFARSGDPNIRSPHFNSRGSLVNSKSMPPFSRLYWPRYDLSEKKFLTLGSSNPVEAKLQQNHRLSLWLKLIPQLLMDEKEFYYQNLGNNSEQKQYSGQYPFEVANELDGKEHQKIQESETQRHISGNVVDQNNEKRLQLYFGHHLLDDYNNSQSYDGVVRQMSAESLLNSVAGGKRQRLSGASGGGAMTSSVGGLMANNLTNTHHNDSQAGDDRPLVVDTVNTSAKISEVGSGSTTTIKQKQSGAPSSLDFRSAAESNTLLLFVGLASALLLFNVIIFAALYCQLAKNRKLVAAQQQQQQQQQQQSSTLAKGSGHGADGQQMINSIQLNKNGEHRSDKNDRVPSIIDSSARVAPSPRRKYTTTTRDIVNNANTEGNFVILDGTGSLTRSRQQQRQVESSGFASYAVYPNDNNNAATIGGGGNKPMEMIGYDHVDLNAFPTSQHGTTTVVWNSHDTQQHHQQPTSIDLINGYMPFMQATTTITTAGSGGSGQHATTDGSGATTTSYFCLVPNNDINDSASSSNTAEAGNLTTTGTYKEMSV